MIRQSVLPTWLFLLMGILVVSVPQIQAQEVASDGDQPAEQVAPPPKAEPETVPPVPAAEPVSQQPDPATQATSEEANTEQEQKQEPTIEEPPLPDNDNGMYAEKAKAPDLEEVVVTAQRREESLFLSGRSVDTLKAKQIQERQPRTVPEALRESPGVFVQSTNYGGGSPIVRGMVGPQVLILVDGIRLNNAVFRTGPLQYLNLLDTHEIEQLEVVRGPGSILYGSDALGATLNARTFMPKDRRSDGEAGVNGLFGGRFGSAARDVTGHALLDGGGSWFGANLTVTGKQYDDLRGGRGVGVQPYSGYDQVNVSGKLMARLSEGFVKDWTFTLGYHLARMTDVGRAEQLQTKHRYNVYQNDHDLVYARGEMFFEPIHTDLELTLSYQRFFEDKQTNQLDDSHQARLTKQNDRITVHTIGTDARFHTALLDKHLNLIYGAEYHKDLVDSESVSRDLVTGERGKGTPPYPEGSDFELGGAYLTAEGELLPLDWDFALRLSAGYRFQHMGGSADAREDLPAIDYAAQAHVFMAALQASYKRHWMSAFTWSQGFRAPNLDETTAIGDLGDWYQVPNESLGPERSDTLEWLNRFQAWRLSGSLAGYITLLSDFIRRESATLDGEDTYDGLPVIRNANGGEARLYGLEAQLAMRLGAGFTVSTSLTYTYGKEVLDDEAKAADEQHRDSRPMSKIPPLFGDARLRWDHTFSPDALFFAETFLLFADKQDRLSDTDRQDVRIPEGGTPGWVTWNLRSGLDLYEALRLSLSLENLTDVKYKYHASGVYGAGTNGILSMELRY